jgi:hypothetical protein
MIYRLPDHPNLLEIEFSAITQGRFPEGIKEMDCTESDLCWGTYNVKSEQDIHVVRDLPKFQTEPDTFRLVFLDKGLEASATVEDHLGLGVYQRSGGFVGRCVSVGKTMDAMFRLLAKKELEVKSSIRPWIH